MHTNNVKFDKDLFSLEIKDNAGNPVVVFINPFSQIISVAPYVKLKYTSFIDFENDLNNKHIKDIDDSKNIFEYFKFYNINLKSNTVYNIVYYMLEYKNNKLINNKNNESVKSTLINKEEIIKEDNNNNNYCNYNIKKKITSNSKSTNSLCNLKRTNKSKNNFSIISKNKDYDSENSNLTLSEDIEILLNENSKNYKEKNINDKKLDKLCNNEVFTFNNKIFQLDSINQNMTFCNNLIQQNNSITCYSDCSLNKINNSKEQNNNSKYKSDDSSSDVYIDTTCHKNEHKYETIQITDPRVPKLYSKQYNPLNALYKYSKKFNIKIMEQNVNINNTFSKNCLCKYIITANIKDNLIVSSAVDINKKKARVSCAQKFLKILFPNFTWKNLVDYLRSI